MSKKLRQKKQYPEDFKTMFGLSTLPWTESISGSFMTGLFMLYLTDYAGVDSFAATLGTILLTLGRIIDAAMILCRDLSWITQNRVNMARL